MIRSKLFKHAFILLFIVGLLNFLAEYLYFYWTFWWFDMMVHFLAGATVSMAVLILLSYLYFQENNTDNKWIKWIAYGVAGALFIGIIWELYELYFGITFLSDGIAYVRDTLSDILMDITGGFFGALYSQRILSGNDNLINNIE